MGIEQHTLEKVGNRHQATEMEQRHLGRQVSKIENLGPDWGDDGITSGAAEVYTIHPGSIPRGSIPISFASDPSWDRFRQG